MKVDFTKPRLKDFDGDLKKKWYIYYRVFNPSINTMETHRIYENLNTCSELRRRYEIAFASIHILEQNLENGWRPFKVANIKSGLAYYNERYIPFRSVKDKCFDFVATEYIESEKITDSILVQVRSKFRQFNLYLTSINKNSLHISQIGNDIILNFFEFLNQKNLDRQTMNKYKQSLFRLWSFAVKKGYVDYNVIANIPKCKRKNDKAARPIKKDDLKIFIEALKNDPQLDLVIKLEFFCLLRPGHEIRFLKVGMIDFQKSIITIPADLSKNRKEKITTIPNVFLDELLYIHKLNSYPSDFYVIGKEGMPNKEYLSKNTISNRFIRLRRKLKFTDDMKYFLYSFKHTGVCAMLDQKFHQNEIVQQAGWSFAYMMEVYSKYRKSKENENIKNNFVMF